MTKHPGGRPTEYDPAYCERVVELAREGMSIEEIAVELGHSKVSLYSWMEIHPEFLNAISRAKEVCEAWWRRQGRTNLASRDFNARLWDINMMNMFGWSKKTDNKQDVTISGIDKVIADMEASRKL